MRHDDVEDGWVPSYPEINDFTPQEKKAIMVVREGRSEDAPVELMIRNFFVWAILGKASDVHVKGSGDRERPAVDISVRTPKGLVNFIYAGDRGKHFQDKLFALTATPQGGSTADIVSARFEISLPARFVRAHGLMPDGDDPYLVSIRVAYMKAFDGFAFVCRLLDQQRAPKLHELGLSFAMQRALMRAVAEPSGLILVSGPTGSGKTTLLNAVLGFLNNGQRSIITIENPVEFKLKGQPVKQFEVGGEITFPRALRQILRMDPDILLIGEIRDPETMEIALQAAQTGHLVLATIHANTAPHTFMRALDLTADKQRDAYRLAETVKFVMAQRLLDRYEGTSRTRAVSHDEAGWLGANGLGFVKAVQEVDSVDKHGKVPVVEAIAVDPAIKDAIRAANLDTSAIYRLACDQPQYETLAGAGLRSVEGLGCKLSDCAIGLDTTTEAAAHPSWRMRLAQEHGISLVQVAAAIDALGRAQEAGTPRTIEACIDDLKELP